MTTPRVRYEREIDGRWIAYIDHPQLAVYGRTRREAKAKVLAIAENVRRCR